MSTDTDQADTERYAPHGYRLGDPISLADFLALPVDGRRWRRDERGRLSDVLPEEQLQHRDPLGELNVWFARTLPDPWRPRPEPSIALPELFSRTGAPIPTSHFGVRAIEPDVALFSGPVEPAPLTLGAVKAVTTRGLRLVVELLSRSTWRNDLGLGKKADAVDRWRSYLASGVPELWILNVGVGTPCPMPPRSGLFLRNAGIAWEALPIDDAVPAEGEVHGLRPVSSGVVRSTVGVAFDLGAFWGRITPPGA
jgi:hypothetical protein